jgi:hypothetical protein
MDAKDKGPYAPRSYGRSVVGLYNGRRPHSSLDGITPDQAYFTPLPLRLAAYPGRGSTYRRGKSVQTTGTTSLSRPAHRRAGAGNQTSRSAVRLYVPDFTIALAIGLVIGFILGYGVRAIISYRRRRRARRHRTFFET